VGKGVFAMPTMICRENPVATLRFAHPTICEPSVSVLEYLREV
jgi:hypothetical protein